MNIRVDEQQIIIGLLTPNSTLLLQDIRVSLVPISQIKMCIGIWMLILILHDRAIEEVMALMKEVIRIVSERRDMKESRSGAEKVCAGER